MTPNRTWTLNSQKYPIYTKYLTLRSKFWSGSLYDQRLPRYHFPSTTMLNGQKKKRTKKMPKIQNFKLHYSFNTFGRHPPQEYPWILESKSDVFFQRRYRLHILLPYGPMLAKTKKNGKNPKFHNFLNNYGRDPPQEYAWFFGSESDVYFRRRCRMKCFLPYDPILTKTKKKKKNVKNQKL